MPESVLGPRPGWTAAGLITLAGFIWGAIGFIQSQNDRIAAEVRGREETRSSIAQVQRDVASIGPQIANISALQGEVRALTAAVARLEASSGPLGAQVRDLDRQQVELRAAIAGHQKDIDAIRLDIVGIKADVVRRGESQAAINNQFRDWIYRPPARNQRDELPTLPDRMENRSARAATADATVDVDWNTLHTREEVRQFLLAYAIGLEPQWRTTARIINECFPPVAIRTARD